MPENIDKIIKQLKGILSYKVLDHLAIRARGEYEGLTFGDLRALVRELRDITESNDLYYKAADRARALWKESHGSDSRWSPGTSHLIVWQGEQLAAREEQCGNAALILQQRDKQLATKEECLQRLKHQWATRETQRLYNKREHNLSQDQLYAALTAADALANGLEDAERFADGVYHLMHFEWTLERAEKCKARAYAVECGFRKLRAAYTATRTQDELSVPEARRMALGIMDQADNRREDYRKEDATRPQENAHGARCICPSCGRPHTWSRAMER